MASMVIHIEAVSDKYKNKYSAGSVKANGVWMQVSSKLDLSAFRKASELKVETEINDKGYVSIVGIDPSAVLETAPAEKPARQTRRVKEEAAPESPKVTSYEDNKNRRILVQGIVQACVQAPGLVSLSITNTDELAQATEDLATRLIAFVDSQV